MLVLFSIAMVCFFALFGMVLILLRQAKSEGAAERARVRDKRVQMRQSRSTAVSDTHAPFGVSQAGDGLTLSNLVPAKQPDWRFMIRESSRTSLPFTERRSPGAKTRTVVGGLGRYEFSRSPGDLTDPEASPLARRA